CGGAVTIFFFFSARRRGGTMSQPEGQGAEAGVQPAADLLPAVYAELRRLAASLAGRLPPGQTLQPTALVHEAYLRLVGDQDPGGARPLPFLRAAGRGGGDLPGRQAREKGAGEAGGGPPPRRTGRGPGRHRTAGRQPARRERGDRQAPGGEAAPGRDRPAP